MWCWSGGRGILIELSLCCSVVSAPQIRSYCVHGLSSSRAFGHIEQQLGAILNGQLQHIQLPPGWSRPSANPAGKFCATSSWGVLFYTCHPVESRILPHLPLDDLVLKPSIWPAIRNLHSVTITDSFLELAQSIISLPITIMVHNGTSSSYRSVDWIGLRSCLV